MRYGRPRVIKSLDEATPIQAAALGDIILGLGYTKVQEKYGLGHSTVQYWCHQFGIMAPPPLTGSNKPLPADNTVILAPLAHADIPTGKVPNPSYSHLDEHGNVKPMGEQLLDYIQNSLITINRQVEIAGDPNYIRKQNAADLAVLHREIGTRFDNLLAAFIRGRQEESEDRED